MPPKPTSVGAGSFGGDAELEVICPLANQDGSQCRKRCLGEKRYRSMQEHIRRAHPNYYIPKLPATEESFQLMINTPPSARPQLQPTSTTPSRRGPTDLSEEHPYVSDITLSEQPIILEGQPTSATGAAVALAQLQGWDSDYEGYADSDYPRGLPSIHDTLPPFQPTTRELLPSVLPSPTGRYTSLPPIQRRDNKKQRPRKPSMGQHARMGKHERDRSKDFSLKEFSRRLSEEGRKAMSAEPPTAAWMQGKRWEDLIEAATTATEADDDRDLTPSVDIHVYVHYEFGRIGKDFVDAAGSGAQVCEKQASTMAYMATVFTTTLSLPQNHVTSEPFTIPRNREQYCTKKQSKQKSTRTNIIVDGLAGDDISTRAWTRAADGLLSSVPA